MLGSPYFRKLLCCSVGFAATGKPTMLQGFGIEVKPSNLNPKPLLDPRALL